ncbi:MAG: DUF6142 family protein [Lachnospiraceae bacterium]|nr:hypothetical protein [Lachnospiraceae bacterium]MCR4936866.1 DUF6142 family protein [Lachnospiraceae bacterium]
MKFPGRYKFSDKTHPLTGVMSFILGLISAASVAASVFLSFKARGAAEGRYALAVLLALIFSAAGIVLGIMGRMKNGCYYFFPNAGIAVNAAAVLVIWIMVTEGYAAGGF